MSDDPEREARVSMRLKFNPRHITELEEWIDRYDSRLPALTNFILPVSKPAHPCLREFKKLIFFSFTGLVPTTNVILPKS